MTKPSVNVLPIPDESVPNLPHFQGNCIKIIRPESPIERQKKHQTTTGQEKDDHWASCHVYGLYYDRIEGIPSLWFRLNYLSTLSIPHVLTHY